MDAVSIFRQAPKLARGKCFSILYLRNCSDCIIAVIVEVGILKKAGPQIKFGLEMFVFLLLLS
jgi:hypothetical protein